MNKLKNILLATTFGLSFGIYSAKAQKPVIKEPIEKHYYEDSKYTPGDKIEVWEYLRDDWEGNKEKVIHKYNPRTDGESIISEHIVPNKPTSNNKNLSKITQEEWEKAYEKTH